MALSIFVGSSWEKRQLAEDIAAEFALRGCSPLRWWKAFPTGSYTLDRLSELSTKADGAVLIFGDDDKIWYRGQDLGAPRDNVLLEYGMFVSHLGRERCVVIRE